MGRYDFTTIIPLNVTVNDTVNATVNDTVNATVKLNKTEKAIINLIKQNSNITQKDLSIKLRVSESTIKRNTNKLKKKGLLERKGSDKNGSWELL